MNKRLAIVFLLGFSSGLPLALMSSTLQAWFASSGMSIMATSMLSLLGLPYIYRILWAPLLDRYNLLPLGKRRSWMFVMQLLLFIGFQCMAWCSPERSPFVLMLLALILTFVAATQDIAIDAHRAEYLLVPEYGLGASLAILGYRIGLLISGGLALVFAASIGWGATYHLMGLLMGVGLLTTLLSTEPDISASQPQTLAASFYAPLKMLLSKPYIAALLGFIFFYKVGEAFTTTTSGIVMPFLIQGIGFDLETIGYVNKMMGIGAIVVGGLVAGILLVRWSFYRALMIFGGLQAVTNLLFVLLAMVGKSLPIFILAVVCDNFAAGMASTALVALLMKLVDKQYTATQLSLLIAFSTIPRVISGPLAAYWQAWFGWVGLYQFSFILSLVFVPFLIILRKKFTQEMDHKSYDQSTILHESQIDAKLTK